MANSTNQGPKIALFEPDIPQNTTAIIELAHVWAQN